VSRTLNLARRPFRNERLPTLLVGLGCLALGLLTVRHGFVARGLLPGQAKDVEREATALEHEAEGLRAEALTLGGETQPAPALKEWAAVKELVDRRAFSWTGLFADLEKAMPPTVRLVGIAPDVQKGSLVISLSAEGREVDDALALYEALQKHPHFRDPQLLGYSEAGDALEITCRVAYAPGGVRETQANGVPPPVTAGPTGGAP